MVLSLLFCLSALAAPADLRLAELEPKLDAFVKTYQPVENTGIAVGIVKDGELVFFKGYGYRDREKKLPVTEHTVFAIGSITKMFVATSLAMLQDEGKVSFDQPVKLYLPEFGLESPAVAEQANLYDLLSHQTGLPRHDILAIFSPFNTLELISKLPYLEMNKAEGMGFRSGKMQYNNLMFMVAGHLVRKLSGTSWYEFVRERIAGPIGMRETSYSIDGFDTADAALPYRKDDRIPYYSIGGAAAAGSMNSTVADMAKWIAFHLADGQGLMRRGSLAKMYEKRSDGSVPEQGIDLGYGLGMMLGLVDGKTVVYHGGNINGFSAHASFMPDTGVGLVVLVNQDGAGNFQHPFLVKQGDQSIPLLPYVVYDHFLKNKNPGGAPLSRGFLEKALASAGVPEQLSLAGPSRYFGLVNSAFYGGSFSEMAYGNISVVMKGEAEWSLNYYGMIFDLIPAGETGKFWLSSEGKSIGMPVEFEMDGALVKAVSVGFEPAVKPIRFVAQPKP